MCVAIDCALSKSESFESAGIVCVMGNTEPYVFVCVLLYVVH